MKARTSRDIGTFCILFRLALLIVVISGEPLLNERKPEIFIDSRDTVHQAVTSPIVIEKYKLLFFPNSKVAASQFKTLFTQMMEDAEDTKESVNLKYLYHYPLKEASDMMTSNEWTRAIFTRDPKERLLSAFLSKVKFSNYYDKVCCDKFNEKSARWCKEKGREFDYFIKSVTQECYDLHWQPQVDYIDYKYWPYINFVGRFEYLTKDVEYLLRTIGGDALEKYGDSNTMSIFQENMERHATYTSSLFHQYYTDELEQIVEEVFHMDYDLRNATAMHYA